MNGVAVVAILALSVLCLVHTALITALVAHVTGLWGHGVPVDAEAAPEPVEGRTEVRRLGEPWRAWPRREDADGTG